MNDVFIRLVGSRSGGDGRLPSGNLRADKNASRKASRMGAFEAPANAATDTIMATTKLPVRTSTETLSDTVVKY